MAKSKVINESILLNRFRPNLSEEVATVQKNFQINENAASGRSQFDIFLCHSSVDKALVLAFSKMLVAAGLSVYVDWIVDNGSKLGGVTAENADMLRKRMKQSNRLIYLHTKSASVSKWCPWEIGYFDALKGSVYVALVSNTEQNSTGQEYLDIYPRFFSDGGSLSRYSFKYETDKHYLAF